jgi:membrane-bound lytic murein transglycosylase F
MQRKLIPMPYRLLISITIVVVAIVLSACEKNASQLARIQQQGELLVGTRNTATAVYEGPQGLEGFEHDLVTGFAKELGVSVRFVFPGDIASLLAETRHARVHMTAAGLVDTPERRHTLRFSHAYQTIEEKLVHRRGNKLPYSLAEIPPNTLHVAKGSSHAETLTSALKHYPELSWVEVEDLSVDTLLQAVNQGDIQHTVAHSNELAIARQIYHYINPSFTIGKPQKLAWAFPPQGDGSLLKAANRFLKKAQKNGTLKRLHERYYGHTHRLNFVDKHIFRRHIRERLPKYLGFFREAEKETGIDWRLLAAIGYQESHWRKSAVSPTGVRGVMMLTLNTAQEMGIKDRVDPRQSILGGAKYLKRLEKRIPEHIQGWNRLWFTLASYNIGYGHLEDARILTQRQNGNPDLWVDVKKRLPLLAKRQYYTTLKHGYARGQEPVIYVGNIRNYYDLLVWYGKNPDALDEEILPD